MEQASSSGVAVLLIASTALLVYKNETLPTAKDRITVCCLLWLTAASSSMQQTSSVWAHVVFGGIVWTIVAAATSRRRQTYIASSGVGVLRYFLHKRLLLRDVLQSLAPAAWVGLAIETLFVVSSTAVVQLSFWLALLCGVACLQWKARQKKRQWQQPLQNINNNDMSSTTSSSDPAHWYEWTPRQVLAWMEEQCSHMDDDNDSMIGTIRLATVVEQCLWGHHLIRLSVNDLRSVLGLPFGVALHVHDQIHDLKRRYPSPLQFQTSSEPRHDDDGWLEELDREHEQSSFRVEALDTSRSYRPAPRSTDVEVGGASGMEGKVRRLMKSQYGLELPSLRKRSGSNAHGEALNANFSPPPSLPPPDVRSPHSNSSSVDALGGLPPEFLANMPPHISEIVRRKPDLVEKILQSRRDPSVTETTNTATSGNARTRNGEAPSDPRRQHVGLDPFLGTAGDMPEDDDDEFTQLLPGHPLGSTRYRSTV